MFLILSIIKDKKGSAVTAEPFLFSTYNCFFIN